MMKYIAVIVFAALVALVLCQEPQIDKLRLPPGFSVDIVARVNNSRQIALNANETWLFSGSFEAGEVYALPITKRDGKVIPRGPVRVIAKDFELPVGLAFDTQTGHLYVSQVSNVMRFDNIERYLESGAQIPQPRLMQKYPDDSWHGWKYLRIAHGRVFAAVGSPCNTCLKDQKVFGIMSSWNKTTGEDYKLHAMGIRNTVGFDFHPLKQNELWFTENGRDEWGNDRPGDELNKLDLSASEIPHFGFPFCYEKNLSDPQYFTGNCLAKYTPAAYVLAPHAAAIGMTFYTGKQFPAQYQGGNVAFIAEHGSWNRDTPIAYRVTMVDTANPDPSSYKVFIDGWLQLPKEGSNDSEYAWGRPSDVLNMKDGSILISDDKSGTIFRVTYSA